MVTTEVTSEVTTGVAEPFVDFPFDLSMATTEVTEPFVDDGSTYSLSEGYHNFVNLPIDLSMSSTQVTQPFLDEISTVSTGDVSDDVLDLPTDTSMENGEVTELFAGEVSTYSTDEEELSSNNEYLITVTMDSFIKDYDRVQKKRYYYQLTFLFIFLIYFRNFSLEKDNIPENIQVPFGWFEWKSMDQSFSYGPPATSHFYELYMLESQEVVVLKSVVIDYVHSTLQAFMLGTQCYEEPCLFKCNNDITDFIEAFDAKPMCDGVRDEKFRNMTNNIQTGYFVQDVWRSNK